MALPSFADRRRANRARHSGLRHYELEKFPGSQAHPFFACSRPLRYVSSSGVAAAGKSGDKACVALSCGQFDTLGLFETTSGRWEVEVKQMKNTKLLVVVDESPATKRSLEYVARIAGRGRGFRVCLAHALPAPPPEMVELRGAEEDRLRVYKRRWISVVELAERRALERANAVLRRGGVAHKAIESHYCDLVDPSRATEEILKLARARRCDTIVIGRESLSWLGELIHGDPAEELVRQGKGFTIWVVE